MGRSGQANLERCSQMLGYVPIRDLGDQLADHCLAEHLEAAYSNTKLPGPPVTFPR